MEIFPLTHFDSEFCHRRLYVLKADVKRQMRGGGSLSLEEIASAKGQGEGQKKG